MEPTAPIPGNPKRRIWLELHRADPQIVVEAFWHLLLLGELRQVWDLSINLWKRITARVNRVHVANRASPNPFAETPNGVARMSLVPELGDDFVFVRRRHEFADFIDRMRERFLAIDMFAAPHRFH